MLSGAKSILVLFVLTVSVGCGGGDKPKDKTPGTNSNTPASAAAEPLGFDTPDAAYDAVVAAIKSRDLATYRRLLAKEPDNLQHFDELVAEVTAPEALEALEPRYHASFGSKKAKRYPAVIDGDRAIVPHGYINFTNRSAFEAASFKKADGKWYVSSMDQPADDSWLSKKIEKGSEMYKPAE